MAETQAADRAAPLLLLSDLADHTKNLQADDRASLLFDGTDATAALAEAEADIVAHMNDDHGEAVGLYARVLSGMPGSGWVMTGVDPEGLDLRLGGRTARLDFDHPVADAEGARAELVRLAGEARANAEAR